MDEIKALVLGFMFGFMLGVSLISAIIISLDQVTVPYKDIIESGCGYYNSDKELVIKDECKKYYGIKEDKK